MQNIFYIYKMYIKVYLSTFLLSSLLSFFTSFFSFSSFIISLVLFFFRVKVLNQGFEPSNFDFLCYSHLPKKNI